RAKRAFRALRFCRTSRLLREFEQEFGAAPIALGRFIDDLLDDGLALADFSPPAILGNNDGLVERFDEQGRPGRGTTWSTFRIARPAVLEPGVTRWVGRAQAGGTRVVKRSWRPRPRGRGHQKGRRLQREARSGRAAPGSGGWPYRRTRSGAAA